MRALTRLLTRLRNLVTAAQLNTRLDEEIAAHLDAQTADNLRAGMSPAEARRQARLKFGPIEAVRASHHAEKSLPLLENLLHDLHYAQRILRKSPAFTAVAVLTLMLGIAANVVVFGVLNAVLLHPLEVRDPQSLYQLRHQQWMSARLLTHSYPAFEDFRRRNTTFTGMLAINAYSQGQLRWQNSVLHVSGDEVTANYFELLGVQPQLGRFFHPADEHGTNSAPYLVVSNSLWNRAFHADPAIIGTTVEFSKQPFTIIGIAPAPFHGTERFAWPDYWIPMANQQQVDGSDYLHARASVDVTVLGRLKPGITPQQATDDLTAISAQLAHEYPQTDDGQPLRLIHPGLLGDDGDVIRGFLWSVTALALLVLAAACANLATLFAARTADRARELALRVALGSSRQRLARQLLTEAALISLLGGAAGLALAYALLAALNRSAPFAGTLTVTIDARVYLVCLALTLISALLFGLLPARQAWHSSPLQSLKNAPTDTLHLGKFSLRDLLLGAQIAICTLLVTASLVAVRGMIRTLHAPLGFQPPGAMLVNLDLSQTDQPGSPSPTAQQQAIQQQAILDAARAIPGVTAAGAANRTPMTGGLHGVPIFPPGTAEFKLDNAILAPYVFQISPGYLEAAGTRLLSGRDLSWQDTANTPSVALVNQTFAHKMWPHTPALGQRFILFGHLTTVVGLIQDGKYHDLQEPPQPVLYQPFAQSKQDEAIFVVRSQRTPREMTAALQQALSSIQPNLPITVQPWTDSLAGELFPAKAATLALGTMGLLAAMLALTGIFGMAANNVSRRMQELGIRVALGARKHHIMRAAVGRPILLLTLGSALGLAAGILASRLLSHIVYQANPRDPLVLAGAILTMALLGLTASALPARRALSADPSKLMRED